MTSAFNARIVIVTIGTPTALPNGAQGPVLVQQQALTFISDGSAPGLDIRIRGQKLATPESSACTIRISNLTRAHKNAIMTGSTPLTLSKNPNRQPVPVTVSVGRAIGVGREASFAPFQLFSGFCWASEVSSPPDITITLTSTTQNLAASTLQPNNFGALATIGSISNQIAQLYGLTPNVTTSQVGKQIVNFSYTGGVQSAINKLSQCGLIRVHVDGAVPGGKLNVYDIGSTVGNVAAFNLNIQNSMVGIPEATESGISARMLIRPEPQIGGAINITSAINPAVNGSYHIHTMNFDIATRDDPFWYELFCDNTKYVQGGS